MGIVIGTCAVTVEATAIAGVPQSPPLLVLQGEFVKANGIVTVTVFGEQIEIPCPTVDLEINLLTPLGPLSLLINAEQTG